MIVFLIKSALALGLFLAIYHYILSKESIFRFNRFYLLFAILFSFSIPLLHIPMFFPSFQENSAFIWEKLDVVDSENSEAISNNPFNELAERNQEIDLISGVTKKESSLNNLVPWILTIYLTGLVFFLGRFVFQINGFFRLLNDSPKVKKEGFTLVLLNEKTLPFTFLEFLFVPKVNFETGDIESQIWEHELAHIRQKHSWDILFVEIVRCVFWFNPLLLLYKKAIQLNHEFLADDAVNKKFQDVNAYQWLLFEKVSKDYNALSLSSSFNYSVTKKRLTMMGRYTDMKKAFFLKILTALFFVAVYVGIAPFKPSVAFQFSTFNNGKEAYERILAEAYIDDTPYVLDLAKLDAVALKMAFESLSEEEKAEVSEFPFFNDAAFTRLLLLQEKSDEIQVGLKYNSPPPVKKINPEVWENWKKTKNVELEIDGESVDASILESHTPEDFVLFEVRGTEPKKFLKKPSFIVKLTTPKEYHRKFILPARELQNITAYFNKSGDRVEASYFLRLIYSKNDGMSIYHGVASPIEQYYIPSILDAFLNFKPETYREGNIILLDDLAKEIPVQFYENGKKARQVFVPVIKDDDADFGNQERSLSAVYFGN